MIAVILRAGMKLANARRVSGLFSISILVTIEWHHVWDFISKHNLQNDPQVSSFLFECLFASQHFSFFLVYSIV